MHIGFVGLGKMGANMVRRLSRGGHEAVVLDHSAAQAQALAEEIGSSVTAVADLVQLTNKLRAPRVIWMMIPAGDPVEETIAALRPLLSKGDVLVDGGNSNFKDTKRRAATLANDGILYVDAGTSGGVWGLEVGYCMMVGGAKEAIARLEPALKTLAPQDGYLHVGPSGAGHYVKMVHNGIEYGMMQAYAEGFDIFENSEFDLDLEKICHLWNQGSVVRSWLLELCERMFAENPKLADIEPWVSDSGEGRWTVQEAIDLSIPAPVITLSLLSRFQSRQDNSFTARALAALRNQFGGHAIKKSSDTGN